MAKQIIITISNVPDEFYNGMLEAGVNLDVPLRESQEGVLHLDFPFDQDPENVKDCVTSASAANLLREMQSMHPIKRIKLELFMHLFYEKHAAPINRLKQNN